MIFLTCSLFFRYTGATMDEPNFYDFDTPEADAPDDAPEDSGFEAGVEVEPSISFPSHGAHWRHSASGKTGAFELTPSGEVTPLSIDVLLRDAQMNDLEVDSEDGASSIPLAPTAVPAFLPLNPMTVRSDRIFTDDDLWELAAELQDANFFQDAAPAPAPEVTSTDSFAHDLNDMHRDGMFGLKVARKGLDPVSYQPSAPTKPARSMEPVAHEESALPPFFPHTERDDSYFDASSNHSARILHDVTHTHISQRGLDNYQNPERLGWVFRTMIAAALLGSVVYVMHRTNVLHARPSVVLRDMMRYLATSDTTSSVNPLLARHVEAVRTEIAGALPDAGSYSDMMESPIVVSSSPDDFLRPDVLTALAYGDRELDAGVVQMEKSAPSTLAVLDGSMSEQMNTADGISAGEFVVKRVEEVPAAPAALAVPVPPAAPDFSQAEALLHNASGMTKLRKSTVMIRQGTHTFAGFTVAQNVIVTSRKALSAGLISGVYGGEQKVGKMITYFPRKDLTYEVLGDAQSDVAFLVFTKPILKAHNIYKIASSGWEAGDAVATCGHPHDVMDTIRTGIIVQDRVLISSGDADFSDGYEGAPLVNAKGEVVGMLVHGMPQPLSAAQLQIPKS